MRRSNVKIHEVPLEQFTKSDPEDSDFELEPKRARAGGASKAPSRHRKKKSRSDKAHLKRRRRESYESDEEIEESDLDSGGSLSIGDDSDEEVEINPRTGRPFRTTQKEKSLNYAESDASSSHSEDIEDGSDSDEGIRPPKRHRSEQPTSLIVTLRLSPILLKKAFEPESMAVKKTRGSRAPSEPRVVSRRSARLSAEPEEMFELAETGRPRRLGGKKVMSSADGPGIADDVDGDIAHKYPSTIQEATQEDDDEPAQAAAEMAAETDEEHDAKNDALVESIEHLEHVSAPIFDDDEEHQPESVADDDSDGSDMPIKRGRSDKKRKHSSPIRKSSKRRKSEESDEFHPESDEEEQPKKKLKAASHRDTSKESGSESSVEEEIDADEIADELEDLTEGRRGKTLRHNIRAKRIEGLGFDEPRRATRGVRANYNQLPPEVLNEDEMDYGYIGSQAEAAKEKRMPRTGGYISSHQLFNMTGPFGGIPKDNIPRFGAEPRINPVDSDDSSDDEPARPVGAGGMPMTPQTTHNMGKTKGTGNADITPVEVGKDINFDSVGGLDDRINSLKEMVMLPLLYPELFERFKSKPPRGVLFSGPPGTGKTLLARALAGSCSEGDRKVTFYMRKGSDIMSKYVGEAERQLRLLFEEAKKNQPAIVFFDEFDGK
jgi:ATPase family AAA domain-containing protein 2